MQERQADPPGIPSADAAASDLNILRQADSHEEFGEGLREGLSVGRAESESSAMVRSDLPDIGFGQAEDPSEVYDSEVHRHLGKTGTGRASGIGIVAR
jgi:hypothetical protein